MSGHLLINSPLFHLLHILLLSAVTGTWTGSRGCPTTCSVSPLAKAEDALCTAMPWAELPKFPKPERLLAEQEEPLWWRGVMDQGSGQAHGAPPDLPSQLLVWAFPSCSNEPDLKRFKHSKAWITNPCNSAGMLVAVWMLLTWTTGQWQNWRTVLQFALLSTPVIPSLLPSLSLSFPLHLPEYISANAAEQVQRSKQVASLH